jgi:2-polyprenyl-6-methoxyphenol hydroxylase-like FAD-dependent oxidoreductase
MAAWQAQPLGDWKAEAVALWPEFEPFLADITRHDQMTPASYTHGTLRHPYAPGLAFIGDAAHRASPQLGQGANMALLDALALSLALDREALDEALPLYARMRRWHVRLYQGMSAAFTPQYQSDSRTLPVLRDWFLAPVSLTPPLPRVLSRLVAGQLIPPLAGVNFP